ncbi:hypothetical protein [Actinokineospora enzanensis]|uniref:hypothetical protein n=1 Tax=Actinokineospora enzanensis TaxID=155975 RepID=UPI0003602035|nr:hypothetical protein [Actinokineospora enzanensis]
MHAEPPPCLPGCANAANRARDLADALTSGHHCDVPLAVVASVEEKTAVVHVSRWCDALGAVEPAFLEIRLDTGDPLGDQTFTAAAARELGAGFTRGAELLESAARQQD